VTPLPAEKAFAEDERSVLLGYLAYHRAVLARKAEGLSDEQFYVLSSLTLKNFTTAAGTSFPPVTVTVTVVTFDAAVPSVAV